MSGRLASTNQYFSQLFSHFQKKLGSEIQLYLEHFSFEQKMEKVVDRKIRHLSTQDIWKLKTVIDQEDDWGMIQNKILSPLLIKACTFTSSYPIAKLLIQKGADPRATNAKVLLPFIMQHFQNKKICVAF